MPGIGIGLGLIFGGGGGGVSGPTLTNVTYTELTETLTATASEAGTMFYLVNDTPSMTGAAIEAAVIATTGEAYGSYALEAGANSDMPDFSGVASGNYYLHLVLKVGTVYSNVVSKGYTFAAVGTEYAEDWSSYANGDTWTQIGADYTRNSTGFVPSIVTDAEGAAGLQCLWGVSSNAHRWMTRDDIAAALAGSWSVVEVLIKIRAQGTDCRAGYGYSSAANVFTGLTVNHYSSGTSIGILVEGDPAAAPTQMVTAISTDSIYWARLRIDGTETIQGKAWADGAIEPASWTDHVHGSIPAFTDFGPMGRTGSDLSKSLYYSVGIDMSPSEV